MALTDFDLVLFGGSGDLAMRKLLPAMFARDVANDLPPTARIICVGRADASQEEFLQTVETTSKPLIKATTVSRLRGPLHARITYVSLNATDAGSYPRWSMRCARTMRPRSIIWPRRRRSSRRFART
jgi:glucose-6-phosphate 1-dehydrogenase